jgi:predicted SAM-dependent methyltransferase
MNTLKYRNKHDKIWLNVASSTFVMEDYINLDNHPFLKWLPVFKFFSFLLNDAHKKYVQDFVDAKKRAQIITHDCRKKLKFPNDSVDHIVCSHFLEHIFPTEMREVVNDFKRCLKHGGTIHIIVPDLNFYIMQYQSNKNDAEMSSKAADHFISNTILSRYNRGNFRFNLMEFMGGFGLNHRWMYDHSSLDAKISELGFQIVKNTDVPSSSYRIGDGSVHVYAKKI